MDKRHTQEKIPEIYLAFFIQCDGNSIDGIKNRKLFRNYLSRFSIECTRIDIQAGRPVVLNLNFDEKKVKTKIHEHLAKLSTDDSPKLERLHIFYFGRYWRKLENILDLQRLDIIADKVHLTSMEMRKYDEILESDMLSFYSGNEHHSISLNDSIDEFYELAIQTKQQHIPLQQKKMDFIKFGSFLAMRNPESNEALNIVNEIVHSHVSSVDLGFVMGKRKIEISEDALNELETQTGLALNRETRYLLYDCYMKTSVARYQRLRNGANSKFYPKSIRRRDSGIVEDETDDGTSISYQNPDFEKQEKYAIMENIIKHPEIYEKFKHNVRKNSQNNNQNQKLKATKPTVAINESKNELIEYPNELDSEHARCRALPMDKYGSVMGSYYHGHPYIGSISDDISTYDNCYVGYASPDIPSRYAIYNQTHHMRYTSYKNSDSEEYTFDEYETTTSKSQTRLMKWSVAVNQFFDRTRFLRNVRMFWQQILCSIFFILGKDFDFNDSFCFELPRIVDHISI